jgi:hypothetical protein
VVKSATINEALQRYELDLKLKNQMHDMHLNQHKSKINYDAEEVDRERQMRRNKQE